MFISKIKDLPGAEFAASITNFDDILKCFGITKNANVSYIDDASK